MAARPHIVARAVIERATQGEAFQFGEDAYHARQAALEAARSREPLEALTEAIAGSTPPVAKLLNPVLKRAQKAADKEAAKVFPAARS